MLLMVFFVAFFFFLCGILEENSISSFNWPRTTPGDLEKPRLFIRNAADLQVRTKSLPIISPAPLKTALYGSKRPNEFLEANVPQLCFN